jgi:hypothetical protein
MSELERGTEVITLADVKIRRFAADFPGWHVPNYVDFLLPTPAGMRGRIISVNHHGHRPWTRYSVRLEDGTHLSDVVDGRDFEVIK